MQRSSRRERLEALGPDAVSVPFRRRYIRPASFSTSRVTSL